SFIFLTFLLFYSIYYFLSNHYIISSFPTRRSSDLDGVETRGNRNAFDAVLGYVPQRDIMHDNLTVEQSLTFTAKLRIAHDASKAEIAAAVAHAIDAVDLNGREKTLISQLSGGQKKR